MTTATDLTTASVRDLMVLVREDWATPYFGAEPYIDALSTLDTLNDSYIAETGRQLAPYFLSNARTWRGETARAVKAELSRRLKAR